MQGVMKLAWSIRMDRIEGISLPNARRKADVQLEPRGLVVGSARKLCELCQSAVINARYYAGAARDDRMPVKCNRRDAHTALRFTNALEFVPGSSAFQRAPRELRAGTRWGCAAELQKLRGEQQ